MRPAEIHQTMTDFKNIILLTSYFKNENCFYCIHFVYGFSSFTISCNKINLIKVNLQTYRQISYLLSIRAPIFLFRCQQFKNLSEFTSYIFEIWRQEKWIHSVGKFCLFWNDFEFEEMKRTEFLWKRCCARNQMGTGGVKGRKKHLHVNRLSVCLVKVFSLWKFQRKIFCIYNCDFWTLCTFYDWPISKLATSAPCDTCSDFKKWLRNGYHLPISILIEIMKH